MGKRILLLRLQGPMQSWGTRARWDVRDTLLEPTKSGIVGLIGCALGLHRDNQELERLDLTLRFGVRIDQLGVVSTDYQTITGYHRTAAGEYKHGSGTAKSLSKAMEHDESTVVSPHDYLYDAVFLIALTVKAEYCDINSDLLDQIAAHLQSPKWPLYLGRKSCVPCHPIFHRLTDDYQDIKEAFENEPWIALRLKQPEKLEAWTECPDGEYERQDAIRLNQLRFYDFRRCHRIEIDTSKLRRTT